MDFGLWTFIRGTTPQDLELPMRIPGSALLPIRSARKLDNGRGACSRAGATAAASLGRDRLANNDIAGRCRDRLPQRVDIAVEPLGVHACAGRVRQDRRVVVAQVSELQGKTQPEEGKQRGSVDACLRRHRPSPQRRSKQDLTQHPRHGQPCVRPCVRPCVSWQVELPLSPAHQLARLASERAPVTIDAFGQGAPSRCRQSACSAPSAVLEHLASWSSCFVLSARQCLYKRPDHLQVGGVHGSLLQSLCRRRVVEWLDRRVTEESGLELVNVTVVGMPNVPLAAGDSLFETTHRQFNGYA